MAKPEEIAVGDMVTYTDPDPHSRYGEFLGPGKVVELRENYWARPVLVHHSQCADGVFRRRSYSYKRVTKCDQFNLPPEKFPIKLEALDKAGVVLWETTLEQPGHLHIPALAKRFGQRGYMRLTFGDGEVKEEPRA